MTALASRFAATAASSRGVYHSPTRLVVKLMLGEAPSAIPAAVDVCRGRCAPASRIDGGPIDRLVHRFSGLARITRVHTAAASLSRVGLGHLGFDDLEEVTGLSRTLLIEVEKPCCVKELVAALYQLERVEAASPYYLCAVPFNQLMAPPAAELEDAWISRDQIHAAEAMAYEVGDPALITAIVDTGVAATHRELSGRLRPGYDSVEMGARDLSGGFQLVGDRLGRDTDPEDEVGHGTACAAIIGARGQALPPGLAGVCPILPIRVLAAAQVTGKPGAIGLGAIPDIDAGMKRAIDLGAKVINMSFGTPESALQETDLPPHADIVRYALAHGCVLVAASGNSGKSERFSPACLDGVIAVGAVNSAGQTCRFTTTGAHVALCAPGERVVSAGLQGYQYVTGTSFAAPFVTATAALLASRARRRSCSVEGATIRKILVDSAEPFAAGQDAAGLGAGILNAHAALRRLDAWIDENCGQNETVTSDQLVGAQP